jgi:hypothetical protein
VKLKLEGGNDTEVSATSPDRPEEIGMVVLVDREDLAAGGHERSGEQVVDGHSVLADQPPDAAAERQTRDSRCGNYPAWSSKTVLRSCRVDIRPLRSTLDYRPSRDRVDRYLAHQTEIEHHPAFGDGVAGNIVPAAFDREWKPVLAGEVYGTLNIDLVGRPDNHGWTFVDHAVPDRPGAVVEGIVWLQQLAAKAISQECDIGRIK